MDLIRELLLALEALNPGDRGFMLAPPYEEIPIKGWDAKAIEQHLDWLLDAGLIAGQPYDPRDAIIFHYLSWAGCDFLDTVRDPEVWRRTRSGASKVGGLAFGAIKDMATAYAKHLAKERLGLDL